MNSVYDQYCWEHGENVTGKRGGVWIKSHCHICLAKTVEERNKRIAELEIDRNTFWTEMVRQKTEIERLQKAEQEALDTAAQRSARILELEAQIESRVTSKAKGWLQVNLELKADNERLRESIKDHFDRIPGHPNTDDPLYKAAKIGD